MQPKVKKNKKISPEKLKELEEMANRGLNKEEKAFLDDLKKRVDGYDVQLDEYRKAIADKDETIEILTKVKDALELLLQKQGKCFKPDDFLSFLEEHDKMRERTCDEFSKKAGLMLTEIKDFYLAYQVDMKKLPEGKTIHEQLMALDKEKIIEFLEMREVKSLTLLKALENLYTPKGSDMKYYDDASIKKVIFENIKLQPQEVKEELKAEFNKLKVQLEANPDPEKMSKVLDLLEHLNDPDTPEEVQTTVPESKIVEVDPKPSPEEMRKVMNEAGMLAEQRSGWGMDPTFSGALPSMVGC